MYRYYVAGPAHLSHGAAGRFDLSGDRSECEATVRALKSLTPARTRALRKQIRLEWAETIARGQFTDDEPPPLLGITIRTSSPTFVQLGEYLSTHLRVGTKGGRLEPSMRVLHTQLQRFDARWELIEDQSAVTATGTNDSPKDSDDY